MERLIRHQRTIAFTSGLLWILLAACTGLGDVVSADGGFEGPDAGRSSGGPHDAGTDGGTATRLDAGRGSPDAGAVTQDAGTVPQNDAIYVSATGPSQVTTGQAFTVLVTMQNTGTTIWSNQPTQGYSLGSQDPQDNTTWGANRFPIGGGDTVPPGAQYTFTANLIAPATPGNYAMQGQMVQETVEWFGQMTPIATVAVVPPQTSSLTVTVVAAGAPLTTAWVNIDAAHQGAVDATGSIQWPAAPTPPFNVAVTAPYCEAVYQAVNAATTSISISMTCGPATPNTDQIDMTQVTVYDSPPDTPSWPVTTYITELDIADPAIGAPAFYINFTKRDGNLTWPPNPPGGSSIEYCLWSVEYIGGQWAASGPMQLWQGDEYQGGGPAGFAVDWYYDSRWGPLNGYQPAVGELVGFFVSAGNARNVLDDSQTAVLERSNVLLVPFPDSNGAVYFVNGPCGELPSGESLGMGQSLVSCDGRFTLTMESGGDLALSWSGGQLWDNGKSCATSNVYMQTDGNLVSYCNSGSNGGPVWSSGTSGNPGAVLVLDNGGNLSVVLNGAVLWQTVTGGH
jgi:hypothetical protein